MIKSFMSVWAEKEFKQYTVTQLLILVLYVLYCLTINSTVWSLLAEFVLSAINFVILIVRISRKEYSDGKA